MFSWRQETTRFSKISEWLTWAARKPSLEKAAGGMLGEFREFAMHGSMLDMAVGIIVGAAFGRVVSSFVSDILMPPIGLIFGHSDFSNKFINLSGHAYATLAEAKAAGAATINYGIFLNAVSDFVIVAFAVFLLIRQVNRLKKRANGIGRIHERVPVLFLGRCDQSDPLSALHLRPDGGLSCRLRARLPPIAGA